MKLSDLLKTNSSKQDKPVLVNANINAENDQVYNNIANATYTDPTGVTGRGYTVNVVAGTATVGAVTYSVAGTRLLRLFDGTAWSTQVLSGANTGDQTFITPRVQSVTSSATVTPTSGNDIVRITAQAEALTLANPTGTFVEGQPLIIRIKDNGTARTIGYGADYRAIGVALPTTTVVNKTTYLGCIWNATDSKLDIVGVCTEV